MKKLLILVPILFLVACNPKKDTKSAVYRPNINQPIGGGINGGLNTGATCANGISNVGSIYDAGQMGGVDTFENRVKGLLSATVSASEVGSISGGATDTTGLRFSGIVKLDANGNVVGSGSNMLIKIFDSYSLSGQSPIPIEFSTSTGAQISGQFNMQTGQGQVTFSDEFGLIRFEGRIDAQSFSGVVKFQNTANVDGGAAASGTLGQFYVARCGIIQ